MWSRTKYYSHGLYPNLMIKNNFKKKFKNLTWRDVARLSCQSWLSSLAPSHVSSVWPWSGAPKVRLYDTFLGGLRHTRPTPHRGMRRWILLAPLRSATCDPTRAEANLSILSIPPRIGSGGSNGVEAALCGVHGGKSGKRGQYLFRSLEPTCDAFVLTRIPPRT